MVVDLRNATSDDLDRAGEVLGRAFEDYPWTRWTVDGTDHLRRVTELQRLALRTYGLPFGTIHVAVVDGAIESAAVWMNSSIAIPPDTHHAIAAPTAALAGCRYEAGIAAEAQLSDWRPPRPHMYLATVGTSPAMQGQGLAAQLIGHALASADRQQMPAFLETSSLSNVAFYERFAFAVVEHRRIDGGGPDVWAMVREPVIPDIE